MKFIPCEYCGDIPIHDTDSYQCGHFQDFKVSHVQKVVCSCGLAVTEPTRHLEDGVPDNETYSELQNRTVIFWNTKQLKIRKKNES